MKEGGGEGNLIIDSYVMQSFFKNLWKRKQ